MSSWTAMTFMCGSLVLRCPHRRNPKALSDSAGEGAGGTSHSAGGGTGGTFFVSRAEADDGHWINGIISHELLQGVGGDAIECSHVFFKRSLFSVIDSLSATAALCPRSYL